MQGLQPVLVHEQAAPQVQSELKLQLDEQQRPGQEPEPVRA